MKVYCWANGVVEYGESIPKNALPLINVNDEKEAKELIVACCALSKQNSEDFIGEEIIRHGNEGIDMLERKMTTVHSLIRKNEEESNANVDERKQD